MSKAATMIGVLAISVAGTAVALQHFESRSLRRELTGLRKQLDQVSSRPVARAAVENSFPSESPTGHADAVTAGELKALRDELAALRKSTQSLTKFAELAQAAQSVKTLEKSGESVATRLVPVTEWRNAGKGTPEAASETALWAAVGGDVDVLTNSLAFNDSSRAKADAWFASLSEQTRQQYGSPEKIIALMIARDAASLTGMQVLGKKDVTPDDVGLRIRFAADGKTKDDTFLMHRSADGWRLLLPDQAVETFARKLSGRR